MAKIIPLPIQQPLVCSSCGAPGEGSCRCRAAYVPASMQAARAVAANPERSDRAIAADIGVSHPTVAKARKATGKKLPVEARTGKDGKKRKMPSKKKKAKAKAKAAPEAVEAETTVFSIRDLEPPCADCTTEEERWHRSLGVFASEAAAMSAYFTREFGDWSQFDIPTDLLMLAEQATVSWQQLLSDLKRRKGRK